MVDDGVCDADYPRVRPSLAIVITSTDRTTRATPAGSTGPPSPCVASGNGVMPWPPTTTRAVPLAPLPSHPLSPPLQGFLISRSSPFSVSAQKQVVSVHASDSMPYSHGHSLDSVVEMVATASSATTEVGLGVQNSAMEVQ